MTHKKFAEIIGVTPQFWRMVRRKERSFSFKKAQAASAMLSTKIELWMDNPEITAEQRKKAWEKYVGN